MDSDRGTPLTIDKTLRRCLNCNYILDFGCSNCCPECGQPFDLNDPKTFHGVSRDNLFGWSALLCSMASPLLILGPVFLTRRASDLVIVPVFQVAIIAISVGAMRARPNENRRTLGLAIIVAASWLLVEFLIALILPRFLGVS